MTLLAALAVTACLLVELAYTWRIRRNDKEIRRVLADLQALTEHDRQDLAMGAVVRRHMEAGTLLDLLPSNVPQVLTAAKAVIEAVTREPDADGANLHPCCNCPDTERAHYQDLLMALVVAMEGQYPQEDA